MSAARGSRGQLLALTAVLMFSTSCTASAPDVKDLPTASFGFDPEAPADPTVSVTHDDGTKTTYVALSTHSPFGIRFPIWWCPETGTLRDIAHGSGFNGYGEYVSGPASSGLIPVDASGATASPPPREQHAHDLESDPVCEGQEGPWDKWRASLPVLGTSRPLRDDGWVVSNDTLVWWNGAAHLCPDSDTCTGDSLALRDVTGFGPEGLDGPWMVRIEGDDLVEIVNLGSTIYPAPEDI